MKVPYILKSIGSAALLGLKDPGSSSPLRFWNSQAIHICDRCVEESYMVAFGR